MNELKKRNNLVDDSQGYSASQYEEQLNQQSSVDNYYQMARDQEYDTLFDKEIQLENIKANANKYAMNALNAQGMGQTGYGQTLRSGIYNQYMNQVAQAQNTASQNLANINLEEAQTKELLAENNFQNLVGMFGDASSIDQINKLLTDYQYGSVDEDGNFVFGTKPEGMSDDQWRQMQYYYNIYKDNFAQQTEQEGLNNEFDMNAKNYVRSDGSTKAMSNIKKNLDLLKGQIAKGEITKGTYIAIEGKHAGGGYKHNNYVFLYYGNDGKLYYTTEATFNEASSKYYIRMKGGTAYGSTDANANL